MKDGYLVVVFFFVVLFLALGGWVGKSHFESSAYNRLTGAHTTTWDAMFLELRVQDTPK